MADVGLTPAKLDIGHVARLTFEVIRNNLLSFLGLSAIFVGIPSLILGFSGFNRAIQAGLLQGNFGPTIIGSLVSVASNALLQGALVVLATAHLNGRKAPISEGLTTGVRKLLPLIGLGIVFYLAFMVGVVLLVIPGIIIGVMWSVATPALILERGGIFNAFSRSRALTKGSRWRIFWLFLIYIGALMVVSMAVTALSGGQAALANGSPVVLIISAAVGIVYAIIPATGVAVIYAELRRIKDGVGVSELASIFD